VNKRTDVQIKLLLLRIFRSCSDFIGAFLLGLYALMILGPLGFLKGPLVLGRAFSYLRILLSHQLLARSVRIAIDWRLGNFDFAIAQAEDAVITIEKVFVKKTSAQLLLMQKSILGDFYTLLTRAYMHAGRIDEAMQTILRAKRILGIERLVGLSALDAKTANLVRAGLAAGKLLDGDGVTTMFVKSSPRSEGNEPTQREKQPNKNASPRKGECGKVIQFPAPD
jgi:hypothetical protein